MLERDSTQARFSCRATSHRGRFQPGPDPRRHEFTLEERRQAGRKGYEAAWESLERRFPGCDPHFLLCAILGSKPWYTLPGAFQEEPAP